MGPKTAIAVFSAKFPRDFCKVTHAKSALVGVAHPARRRVPEITPLISGCVPEPTPLITIVPSPGT